MMSQSKISQGLSKVEPWNIIDSAQIITDEKEINLWFFVNDKTILFPYLLIDKNNEISSCYMYNTFILGLEQYAVKMLLESIDSWIPGILIRLG